MPGMLGIDAVERMINTYTKQLEELAYSKNAAMAARLSGALDAALQISGFSGSAWAGRIDRAMSMIMADKPAMQPLTNTLPDTIAAAVTLPAPQKPNQPPTLTVVPPMPKI